MEGTSCSQEGCRCRDFLPFTCSLCFGIFCLDHRSRFAHNCIISTIPINSDGVQGASADTDGNRSSKGVSVKSIFRAVEDRFATEDSPYDPKLHFNVQSSAIPQALTTDSKFKAKIESLEKKDLKSAKEHRINMKVRSMLIKSKAIGGKKSSSSDLAEEKKVYLDVNFGALPQQIGEQRTGDVSSNRATASAPAEASKSMESTISGNSGNNAYMYFATYQTLGEMLQNIHTEYPQILMRKRMEARARRAGRVEGGTSYIHEGNDEECTLIAVTSDTPDWRYWDRSAKLEDLLSNFETIYIDAAPLKEVVSNQELLESRRAAAAAAASSATSSTSMDASLPPPLPQQDNKHKFSKNDTAWYLVKVEESMAASLAASDRSGNVPAMVPVKIVGVHLDDFPNIYYTVVCLQFDSHANCDNSSSSSSSSGGSSVGGQVLLFEHEKQTSSSRLFPYSSFSPAQVGAMQASAISSSSSSSHDTAENVHVVTEQEGEASLGRAPSAAVALVPLFDNVGPTLNVRISHGTKNHDISIGSLNTVAQLKQLVASKCTISAAAMKAVKLICKGSILKNDMEVLTRTKVVDGVTIKIMGGPPHVEK